jgi:BirA family biotin operon repressor/biotin-[acetyl-CoA-carboxylase] ligase
MAMATIDALESLNISGLAAKWPNDIVSTNGKVGGILMEVAGEHNGPCHVVVGIGLNISMPCSAGSAIEQSWSNIAPEGNETSRNQVAIALLDHLFEAIQRFEAEGPASFMQRWQKYDFTYDKEVNIHLHSQIVSGIAQGVDERGFIIVAHDGKLSHYSSGEISLRVAD